MANPFSLLFCLALLFWLLITGRRGLARWLDVALFYFFDFVILRNDWAVLWYLMMMFSVGMISFPTAAAINGIIAAGLSMFVSPRR